MYEVSTHSYTLQAPAWGETGFDSRPYRLMATRNDVIERRVFEAPDGATVVAWTRREG